MDFLTPSLTSNDRVLRLKHCHGNQQADISLEGCLGQFCSSLWRNGVQWSSECWRTELILGCVERQQAVAEGALMSGGLRVGCLRRFCSSFWRNGVQWSSECWRTELILGCVEHQHAAAEGSLSSGALRGGCLGRFCSSLWRNGVQWSSECWRTELI